MNQIVRTAFSFLLCLIATNVLYACDAPVPSIISTTPSRVVISWPAVTGAASYETSLVAGAMPNHSFATSQTTTSITLTSLRPDSTYTFCVRTNCTNGDTSTWSCITFRTNVCGTPATINIYNVTATTANISWTSVAPGASYQYVVDTTTATPPSGTHVDTNWATVSGLLSNSTYTVFVRTICGTSFSGWESTMFFTSFPTNITTVANNIHIMSVYPNPANNTVTLKAEDGTIKSGHYIISNVMGSVLQQGSVAGNTTTISVSSLATGIYLLRYTDGEHTQTIKLYKN